MEGLLALVGSGAFTPALEAVDREALAATGRSRPRVAIVATAAVPEGRAACLRLAEMGRQHFGALGAEVEAVPLYDRADAADDAAVQAIGEADLVYLCDGRAAYLCDVLAGTAAERALADGRRRGAVIVACGGGAAAVADRRPRLWRGRPLPRGWAPALGLVPGAAVIPAYDAVPEVLLLGTILMPPRAGVILGLDRETALLGRAGTWQVAGAGRLTLWRGRHRSRYRDGDTVRFQG